ncbi:hypothetical protein ACFL1Z_00505 [Thermodesulfobacteriota bacterium]
MKKRMAIISSYFKGEAYGVLGPQMAATIIQDNTPYDCIVVVVARDDDKALIKETLADYFGSEKPVIGFSTLSGREDLFSFANELKEGGAVTILAGPQAASDYLGEEDWENNHHRFMGLSKYFTYSLHGPAEQAIHLLNNLQTGDLDDTPGLLYYRNNQLIRNASKPWDKTFLRSINWNNIYKIDEKGLIPIDISIGQVLQQIGCPHASREKWLEIDYPTSIIDGEGKNVNVTLKGCSFCDVAMDKGFFGELDIDTVISQIQCLPEDEAGRKIPFELINENPLFNLPHLLRETRDRDIRLSRINLILRADWFLKGEERLRESLTIARDTGTYILLSSMGFEAFDDKLLRNFNKGVDVKTNLEAIRLMRHLKETFPKEWGYSKIEGAIHGFIHPTPWDTKETFANTQKNIAIYGLSQDILPPNSTPLIIHHASALGDWIREVERREDIKYKRYGSVIGWWDE